MQKIILLIAVFFISNVFGQDLNSFDEIDVTLKSDLLRLISSSFAESSFGIGILVSFLISNK